MHATSAAPTPRRAGARITVDRETEIFDAAKGLLLERGFAAFTMDELALRARCSKPTLYRRWRSKSELAADIVAAFGGGFTVADTGSLRGDLYALVEQVAARMHDLGRLFLGVVIEMQSDRQLAERWDKYSLVGGEDTLKTIVDRAVARGEAQAGVDYEPAYSMIPGTLIWYFMVEAQMPREAFMADFVERILTSHIQLRR